MIIRKKIMLTIVPIMSLSANHANKSKLTKNRQKPGYMKIQNLK